MYYRNTTPGSLSSRMEEPDMDESACTNKNVQELLTEVDDLVYEVCERRKKRPAEILEIIKEANTNRANRLAGNENINVIPPKDSLINSEEVTARVVGKLTEAEERNKRLVAAETESKQLQATLKEQREILDALHSLLNSEYAPIDCPRIPSLF